ASKCCGAPPLARTERSPSLGLVLEAQEPRSEGRAEWDEPGGRMDSGVLAAPPDLVAIAIALLDPEPARRPSGDEILQRLGAPPPPRTPVVPFVGRGRELAALHRAWDAALERPSTALVRGASGVGKSALVARFADELRAGGA